MTRNSHSMTRREFIKQSSAVVSVGLLGLNVAESSTKYRVLGKTGIKVTSVGFGASRTMEPTLVKNALDVGMNFLDTGPGYFKGQNEIMVGKVIKEIRKDIVVQSKIPLRMKEKGDQLKTAEAATKIKKKMQSSLDKSLKALQTDYIDSMLLHGAKSEEIIHHEAVMEFFREAKKKGQIRACGFSSHKNQLQLLKSANETKFYDIIMVPYNHKGAYVHSGGGSSKKWDQPALEAEFQKAEKNGIGIVAMKTCSGGTYSPDGITKPSYKAALKWVVSHGYISTMAVAMGNMDQIKEDIQAME